MYGLYDREGILRYVNTDKDACIAYAELFDLNTQSYLLMSLNDTIDDLGDINFDQNLIKLLGKIKMYGLYDREGILRYVNTDKDACIAYAELFDLNTQSYLLMSLNDTIDDLGDINFDQNPAKNSN